MAVTYSYLAGVGCHLIILVDRSVCEENLIHAALLHQHMFQFHWLLIDSHSEARGQLSGRAQLTPSHLKKNTQCGPVLLLLITRFHLI